MSLESTPDAMFRSDAVKYALIGVMRDLRGIAMATNRLVTTLHIAFLMTVHFTLAFKFQSFSRRNYGLLFDWLYPKHMTVLLKGISHWADTPEVSATTYYFLL